jgi:hypothetical protein
MEKYVILGSNTIYDWLEKYGDFVAEGINNQQQIEMKQRYIIKK